MKVFKSFYDSELDSWVIINEDVVLGLNPEFVLKEEILKKLEEHFDKGNDADEFVCGFSGCKQTHQYSHSQAQMHKKAIKEFLAGGKNE